MSGVISTDMVSSRQRSPVPTCSDTRKGTSTIDLQATGARRDARHAAVNSSPGDLFGHLAIREAQGLRSGGFGLLLAKKLVDELIYSEHGNDVLLVKYVDAAASRAS